MSIGNLRIVNPDLVFAFYEDEDGIVTAILNTGVELRFEGVSVEDFGQMIVVGVNQRFISQAEALANVTKLLPLSIQKVDIEPEGSLN